MQIDSKVMFGLDKERTYIPGRFVKSPGSGGESALNPGFIDVTGQEVENVGGLISVGSRARPVTVIYNCRPNKTARHTMKYGRVLWEPSEINITDSHRFFPLKDLDLSTIQGIVNTQHAVTFIEESPKEARLFLKQLKGALEKSFKVMFMSKHTMDMCAFLNTHEKENLVLSVSCINLPFCIPIFDARRADGMGIILSAIVPERSENKLIAREEICQIVGNNRTNITHADGASLKRDTRFDSARVEHLESLFGIEEKRRKERDAAPKAEDGKKKKAIKVSRKPFGGGVLSTGTISLTSTSTAVYYNEY